MKALSSSQFYQKVLQVAETQPEFAKIFAQIKQLYPASWRQFLLAKQLMLQEYFRSLTLMEKNECQQRIPGYRLNLRLVKQKLFFFQQKCPHFKRLFVDVKQYYQYADFNLQLQTKNFKDFAAYQKELEIGLLWEEFENILTEKQKPILLFLSGSFSTGKTLFTALFCNAFIKHFQKPVAFLNARRIILIIKDLWAQKKGIQAFLNQLIKVDLLVIDDLGMENTSAFIRDEFFVNLLEQRKNQNRLTILTSKLTIDGLLKNYLYNNSKLEQQRHALFANLLKQQTIFYKLSTKITEKW